MTLVPLALVALKTGMRGRVALSIFKLASVFSLTNYREYSEFCNSAAPPGGWSETTDQRTMLHAHCYV